MNQLTTNIKKSYCIFFVSLTALLFLLVFLPMRRQLEYQVTENYYVLAESKRQTVMTLVANCISNANSLSSRSAIKDFIVHYNTGKIDWNTLRYLTSPKYYDGLAVINHLDLAARIIDSHPLIVYNPSQTDFAIDIHQFKDTHTKYAFDVQGKTVKIVVNSPIMCNHEPLGYDMIIVNISSHLQQMESNGCTVTVLDTKDHSLGNIEMNKVYKRHHTADGVRTFVALPIDDRYLLLVSKPANEVFESLNRISLLSIVGLILGLALIFIILQNGFVKLANSMIEEIGSSRDTYMKYANYDALTGAYTRGYLVNWIKKNSHPQTPEPFIIGMIDIDRFKSINDTFGHQTGDKVLTFIAKTLMTTIGEKGFVVRFGGDEFITICNGSDMDAVLALLNDINRKINLKNPFLFDISLSFGTEKIDTVDALYDALKSADEKMYENKKRE